MKACSDDALPAAFLGRFAEYSAFVLTICFSYRRVKIETNAQLQARHREEIHPTLLTRCEAAYFSVGYELKSN